MSIWAERFAALSPPHDKFDKSDKRSIDTDFRPFVANCQSVHDKRSAVPSTSKSAEILGLSDGVRPFVPFVAFIKRGNEAGLEVPADARPFVRAPLTKADKSSEGPDERAVIIAETANAPRTWAEGVAALWAMPVPTGFLPDRWRRVVNAAGLFINRWGNEAIQCGWNTLDVFGAYADAPTARFDCMGLILLLDRAEIISIDPDGADLLTASGAKQRFRRRPLPPGTVSLWKLGQ